jgi:hypothetical protein
MIEKLFEILNIQETWESIILQLKSLVDPENFFFGGAFKMIIDTVSDNPLASIITLLAVVGLPYTLFKAKKSSTEASERLDQLMDEMKDFEFQKPLIDLQEKFKENSIDSSPVINYDHDVLELNFERAGSASFNNEEDSDLQDLESSSFVKQITLDQDVTDDFLASGSRDPQSELDIGNLDLSPFEEEEAFDNTEINQPEESSLEASVNDEEYAKFFNEVPKIRDEEQDLVLIEEEVSNEMEIDQPVDSIINEEENTIPEVDDLKTRMEQAIQKLNGKYAPLDEADGDAGKEIKEEPVPSVIEPVKKSSLPEETNIDDQDEITSLPSSVSISSDSNSDSPNGEQKISLEKSHVITHLNSFKKNLENQLDLQEKELKKNSTEPSQEQNPLSETILKQAGITWPPPSTATDEEYQQTLESFLLLKNQKKPE